MTPVLFGLLLVNEMVVMLRSSAEEKKQLMRDNWEELLLSL
jgi:hypothetical protein